MDATPSQFRIFLARSALALMIGFVVVGAVLYGFSVPVFERIWHDMLERTAGTRAQRKDVAAFDQIVLDGLRDARTGRRPYFWTILTDPAKRTARLNEGLIATARVLLLGVGMDLIYQYIVLKAFYPAEAVIVAVLLAFIPYLILRGPVERIAHWWLGRASPK